jgi:hypothetical protein
MARARSDSRKPVPCEIFESRFLASVIVRDPDEALEIMVAASV